MRGKGFSFESYNPSEWTEARILTRVNGLNTEWDRIKLGLPVGDNEYGYPIGTFGYVYRRWMKDRILIIQANPKKKLPDPGSDHWVRAWKYIEPRFALRKPDSVTLEDCLALKAEADAVSPYESHMVMKIWRGIWRRAAIYGFCGMDKNPASLFPNEMPHGRRQIWRYDEVVRLVKRAIRMRYYGLACAMATAWDTQFQPGDVVNLTPIMLCSSPGLGVWFDTSRAKTGRDAVGTLSSRTARLLRWYLREIGADLANNLSIFRTPVVYENTAPMPAVGASIPALIREVLAEGPLDRAAVLRAVTELWQARRINKSLNRQAIDSALFVMKKPNGYIIQGDNGRYSLTAKQPQLLRKAKCSLDPYTREQLGKHFVEVREAEFGPDEKRQLRDMRRSGTVEAMAGGASDEVVGEKMANNFASDRMLKTTYNPTHVVKVRKADQAREIGRQRLKDGQGRVVSGPAALGLE